MAATSLIPAAQYLRMSTEDQQYSITNQRIRILEYAQDHGFDIIKTYEDPGRSGVIIKHRRGLSALLKDVLDGDAAFKAILVYDVSRWGRFQNPDEAAHYEFLCVHSGIPLHYCAEQFSNDGTASSSILKALKRSMAAEFSRELGEKVFRGKTQIVRLGYWVGGPPGYGYRRRMVSPDGHLKQLLKKGEQKSLKTDRVTLVLGPRKEIEGVRLIFSMAAAGENCTDIVRALNRKEILLNGRLWNDVTVLEILSNPKYAGCNVWHRRTQRLNTPLRHVDPTLWISKPNAFPPIVDQRTFDLAQLTIRKMRDSHWTPEKVLKKVRRLWKIKGKLSEKIFREMRGGPCTNTIHKFFGTYRQLYDQIGYCLEPVHVFRAEQFQRSTSLRRALGVELQTLFPDHVATTLSPRGKRLVLRIDETFMVSLLFCGQDLTVSSHCWSARPVPSERNYVTLICLLNRRYDRILRYYIAANSGQRNSFRLRANSPVLQQSVRLESISEFYKTVKAVWSRTVISEEPEPAS